MQYRACDLCGGLVASAEAPKSGFSLICGECLRTRKVRTKAADEVAAPKHPKHTHKFPCAHCGRNLRAKPVTRELEMTCPSCGGGLIIEPGGTARARGEAPPGATREPSSSSSSSLPESDVVARLHETQDPDRAPESGRPRAVARR